MRHCVWFTDVTGGWEETVPVCGLKTTLQGCNAVVCPLLYMMLYMMLYDRAGLKGGGAWGGVQIQSICPKPSPGGWCKGLCTFENQVSSG